MSSENIQPVSAAELLTCSRSAQNSGDFTGMLEAAQQAHELDPAQPDTALRLAECHLLCGQVGRAIEGLKMLEELAQADGMLLQRIAALYTQCSQFRDAQRCHRRAAQLSPGDSRCLYNLAASCIATGELKEAEQLLTEVIRLDPRDYDAWQNRSTLRRQTPDSNHVEQLRYVLEQMTADDPGRVQICYALAREMEDLGRYKESFQFLQQGAMARRQRLDYDVGHDVAALELIEHTFTAELLQSRPAGHSSTRPVFVLGLPRSGTTLVDRIINAHSQAASLGEINTLVFALMRTVAEEGSKRSEATNDVQSRTELIRRSAQIDFSRLGDKYAAAIGQYGHQEPRLVDKTPLNFLYLGLIHLALPEARIIHLRRNPVDSCYAMYKTLFRMGYPFSYSLQDVGRYYMAYHRLMAHWRAAMPGAVLDVDYERLVTDQENESRRILDWCGLEWEDACMEFHRSDSPAATASAAQVRQAMYSTSVGNWRHYQQQLAPFVAKLREHGIPVD
ncbi:MAG: tetratricopeptide repeat-containing sulfotransferase family protein [Lysobacterales bacterium]